MRSTGIIRKVDGLGRIVIPMEVRRSLEIYENDHVSIGVDGETIVLQRHRPFVRSAAMRRASGPSKARMYVKNACP